MKQIFKNKNALLAVLIVGIIAMTVAFAALTTQLNIFGTAKISSGSYNIVIDDWTRDTSQTSIVSGQTNTAYEITPASVTSNTMTIENLKVGFKQPGDAVKYTFNIENRGTIDASLEQFNLGTPTCKNTSNETVTCPSMTYEVKCGSPLATPAVGTDLLAGQTIPCTYYLAYNEVNESNEYSVTGIEVSNITATFKYTQKASNSYTPQTTKYKLTLNSMGGSSVSNIEALGGSEITLPEPTKTNYEFDGWYTEETGGTKITSSTMPTSNTTYYAHWNETFICKKATTLHTEICAHNYTDALCNYNHQENDVITYGHTTLTNGKMTAGYALDCKVSSTGDYTERFYYVSDYYDTNTQSFDSSTASLIYYASTYNGLPKTTGIDREYYGNREENWHGPVDSAKHMPTTSQWNNIQLKSVNRQIIGVYIWYGETYGTTVGSGDNLHTLPVYSYSGKAARLLTYQEVKSGCPNIKKRYESNSKNSLKNCEFLFESTRYANSNGSGGVMLENPDVNGTTNCNFLWNNELNIISDYTYFQSASPRPVIDVPYSKIQLQ